MDHSIRLALLGMLVLAAIAFAVMEEYDNAGPPLDKQPQAGREAEAAKFRHDVGIAAKRLKAAERIEARRHRAERGSRRAP